MKPYVLSLDEIDRTQSALAGGKGANLGELSRISGVNVPAGFVVTTAAFERMTAQSPLPDDVVTAIERAILRLGEHHAYAVRSSATAEDLATASFAGQYDSYLNIVGVTSIVEHVRRCWESLHSERTVAYRERSGIDDANVRMAVIVQRMVPAEAAGVLFTADPITGHRKNVSIEAVRGLGEKLVSGHANAEAVLTDEHAARLVELGRRIEAHFGAPQDIEWCLADNEFHFVQSRPITTLFPIPESDDNENHLYVSVGHAQMMTDPMKPLGLSFWQMTTPRPMAEAGGRLFVDVTKQLGSPASRAALVSLFKRGDPLAGDAFETILERGDFIPPLPESAEVPRVVGATPSMIETDPAIVAMLIDRAKMSIAQMKEEIRSKSGGELFEFIREDLQELKRVLFAPDSHQATMAGMEAAWWLNDKLEEWLGEKNVADVLTQSVAHNVTSEMGLALLDVADAFRIGEAEGAAALQSWLDAYGMRGVGEIDLTRTRWSEQPGLLQPIIAGHVNSFEPGEHARRFERGLRAAEAKEKEILARLRSLPDGDAKAAETKRMIDRVRTFAGYREYPKFGKVVRYFEYKTALLREADRLVKDGVISDREDIFFLRFEELEETVRTRRVDQRLIARRKEEYRSYRTMTPPRVMTSDGEVITGSYRRDHLPAGALAGLGVSAGIVEGRARVVFTIEQADLAPGDILVTPYTDPSWTPLFVTIKGLVTEVGGLMTHGAVIAREYGLPAVVSVEGATKRIRDGQRIRLDGTSGFVELLD
jgi:pyruvate,water dikinase